MSSSEDTDLSIPTLSKRYRSGAARPLSVIERSLESISDSKWSRVFWDIDADSARAAAAQSDARWRRGEALGPLDGAPVAIKNNVDVAGLPTRAGLPFVDTPAVQDAPVVAALRAAGAVVVGTVAMDEGACFAEGRNSHFGVVPNPRAPGCVSGGSSSGSAAAVAAGLVSLAVGSDTMGSVRIPAAYCGIVGLKPTYNALSLAGVVPLNEDFDCLGFLADNVAAVAAGWRVFSNEATVDPSQLRVGVPELPRDDWHADVAAAIDRVAELLGEQAETFDPKSPDLAGARKSGFLLVEAALAATAATAGWPRAALSPTLRGFVEYGTTIEESRLREARATCAAVSDCWRAWAAQWDVFVLPTCRYPAFAVDAPAPKNQPDYTGPANFSGLPALSLPAGNAADGRPVAVQLVAGAGKEDLLLGLAAHLETLF